MESNSSGYNINFTIPQGITGPTGEYSIAFGGMYSEDATTIDRSNPDEFSPVKLNLTVYSQLVFYNENDYSLTIEQDGVYLVSFNATCKFVYDGEDGLITMKVNDIESLIDIAYAKNISYLQDEEIYFGKSAIVRLTAGTVLRLLANSTSSFKVGSNTNLTLVKLCD